MVIGAIILMSLVICMIICNLIVEAVFYGETTLLSIGSRISIILFTIMEIVLLSVGGISDATLMFGLIGNSIIFLIEILDLIYMLYRGE